MSSAAGIRLGFCLLRYGPQWSGPTLWFCRQSHSIADPRSTNSGKISSSCGISTLTKKIQIKPFYRDLTEEDKQIIASSLRFSRRFIEDFELVKNILFSLDPWDRTNTPFIIECNPGSGTLTRALLDTGCDVVALETDPMFLPGLKELEESSKGQLRTFHGDFLGLDILSKRRFSIPDANTLMEHLGIRESPWHGGILCKVFGILPSKNQSNCLWRYIYCLYQRLSLFRYGRVEFYFFMDDKMCQRLFTKPGNISSYHALTVLFNLAFDVELMHQEPVSAFFAPKKSKLIKKAEASNDLLSLVRITPRENLFSERFTPSDGLAFINMVKQCLVKRKTNLRTKLDCWIPGEAEELIQRMELPMDTRTGDVYPVEYKLLFESLAHSVDFSQKFIFEECEDPTSHTRKK